MRESEGGRGLQDETVKDSGVASHSDEDGHFGLCALQRMGRVCVPEITVWKITIHTSDNTRETTELALRPSLEQHLLPNTICPKNLYYITYMHDTSHPRFAQVLSHTSPLSQ